MTYRSAAPLFPCRPRKVEGGWRVTGKWSYNSAAPYATWAALGALLKDDAGAVLDQALVLIPHPSWSSRARGVRQV